MRCLRQLYQKTISQAASKTTNPLQALRCMSGYSWIIILSGCILISSLWAFILYHIHYDYERTIANASQETMNLAIAFEEHVSGIVADTDKDLINLKWVYEQQGLSSPVFAAMANSISQDSARNLIGITNEQGIIVYSRLQSLIGLERSDRDYFIVHQPQDSQQLYIGKTLISQLTAESTIPLSRRINKPDGSFGGIVYIGLRTDYFLSFYNKINLGENQRISLIGLDGFVRARQSAEDIQAGQDISNTFYKSIILHGPSSGSYVAENVFDDIQRVASYRIMSEYPLIVTVGKTTQRTLAAYNQRKYSYLLGSAVSSLLIMAFCFLLISRHENAKRLTKAIQQDRDRLAVLFSSINDEVWFADTQGKITLANPPITQRSSLLDTETEGENSAADHNATAIASSPLTLETSPLLRALQGEVIKNEQAQLHNPALDAVCYYEINANPVRENTNTIIGAIAIVRDITERKALEDELRKHRDHLQTLVEEQVRRISEVNAEMVAIFESISEPFFVLDNNWQITYINKIALQLLDNRLSKPYIGQNIWSSFPEMIGNELYRSCYRAVKLNKPLHRVFQSANSKKVFDIHLYPYTNGLFVYMRDITKQKAYEAEIARLDRLNLIGEMAASIGHEVRNPMTTVRGYLQRFGQKPAFANYHEQLQLMIEELDRANSIITEFLSLAKNKKVALKETDLNAIIGNLFPLLQADAFRRGHTIELKLEYIGKIVADESEIRQCLLNLVSNGMDAMPQNGTITISTAKVVDEVVMTVRDTGTGIPPSIIEKIGTPFVTTKESGTGLGLAVCYRIAHRNNATIEFETAASGTAFHFKFNKQAVDN